jgi:translation initiation factor IF-2
LSSATDGPARGVIVEATLDKGRGPVATVLVQSGTLNKGDTLVCGTEFGRVRAMYDENGLEVETAGPSIPVAVQGLSSAPNAGDDAIVTADEKTARELAEVRRAKLRDIRLAEQKAAKLNELFEQMGKDEVVNVNLVVKADVHGSVEAIKESLENISTDEVKIRVVASGVGGINESDANLAASTNAIVIGFNVRADAASRRILEERGLELRYYSIIYEVIDDVRKAASGLLSPEIREEIVGLAEVRDVFRSSRIGAIAGCMVLEGVVKRNNPIRVLRDNIVIFEGELESLRRFKDDVAEVRSGTECGIGVKSYNDIEEGDQIEVFERTKVAREL